jgi:EmrB/QacA subfamily drug resistance transporter
MASKWWTLSVVCLAIFMLLLDITVVNVALPDIQKELGASFEDLQWVVDAYALALAALLLASGSIADLLGRRRVFVAGLLLFVTASLLCGLSSSPMMLNVSRGFQGLGGAMMFATSLALIAQEFAPNERGTAFGIWGATTGFAVAVGPLVGGALTDAFGWEWIFLVNVPIGLVLLAAGTRLLPTNRPDASTGLDLPGLLTLSPAVLLIVTPLVLGPELGWPVWGWATLAGSAAFVAAFVRTQRRAADPLVPGPVLRAPGLALAAASILTMMAGYAGFLFIMALYLQDGLGLSTLQSSLAFVLSSVGFGAASLNWRRVPARFHHGMIPAGLTLSALGYLAVAAITANLGSPGILYQAATIASGVGMGLAFSPALDAALRHVPLVDAANASGVMSTVTQLGQVAGVAGLGAVFLALSLPSGSVATAAAVSNIGVAALVLLAAVFAAFLPRR